MNFDYSKLLVIPSTLDYLLSLDLAIYKKKGLWRRDYFKIADYSSKIIRGDPSLLPDITAKLIENESAFFSASNFWKSGFIYDSWSTYDSRCQLINLDGKLNEDDAYRILSLCILHLTGQIRLFTLLYKVQLLIIKYGYVVQVKQKERRYIILATSKEK